MKAPKILYFVDGMAPTADDLNAASEIMGQVVFRNSRAVPASGAIEECDGVAGNVPEPYAKCPTPDEAAKKYADSIKAKAALVGDSPAPVPPAAPASPPQGDADKAKDQGEQSPPQVGTVAGESADKAKEGKAPDGAAGSAWR